MSIFLYFQFHDIKPEKLLVLLNPPPPLKAKKTPRGRRGGVFLVKTIIVRISGYLRHENTKRLVIKKVSVFGGS